MSELVGRTGKRSYASSRAHAHECNEYIRGEIGATDRARKFITFRGGRSVITDAFMQCTIVPVKARNIAPCLTGASGRVTAPRVRGGLISGVIARRGDNWASGFGDAVVFPITSWEYARELFLSRARAHARSRRALRSVAGQVDNKLLKFYMYMRHFTPTQKALK